MYLQEKRRKFGETDGKRDEEKRWSQDEEYFRSYADVSVHEEMLSDTVRTNAYRYAILKNYEKIRGKIVADIGAGTGILSVFCVHAGAKKVYAIEASDMAEQTQRLVEENKMEDRIDVIQNKIEDVEFPEELDVIVSEWMGYCLFYESMLPSVLHCRDKWLKKDGLMLPSIANLYLAPFCDEDYDNRLDFWTEIKSVYKVSMESMKPYAQKCIASHVHVNCMPPESVQAHAHVIKRLDLKHVPISDLQKVKSDFRFRCFGHSEIHGFITWFTVDFPDSISLTTSPYTEDTHWAQCQFYLDAPEKVKQDTTITGTFSLTPNKDKPRFLDINIEYQFDSGPRRHKYYYMNDCIT
ncbi:hypothetical protein CHS0354_011842 [Potamilus streckersoni]|uniref:Protein arginine N-methyltransferase 6 n=1 Tax=Potamilus streckersoni TaxID=2493646 RepID=A0AAE0TET2_9BIVA|nr:hypothetical protein CHS0354_011842 [Potamilus streckersoni]